MAEKIATPETAKPAESEKPKPQVYFSIGTNFTVQMTRPRKVVVDGEFIVDHGKSITFTPLDGPRGASCGSRYETTDPDEIKFLDEQCIVDKLHVSKQYRLPQTARTALNVDVEVLVAEEKQNGQMAIFRKQQNTLGNSSFTPEHLR